MTRWSRVWMLLRITFVVGALIAGVLAGFADLQS